MVSIAEGTTAGRTYLILEALVSIKNVPRSKYNLNPTRNSVKNILKLSASVPSISGYNVVYLRIIEGSKMT